MGERTHTPGLIDLSHFCYTEDDRSYLKQPWSRGDFTYATNGHIMVRVPRRPDILENDAAPDGERVLSKLSFNDLRRIEKPELPPLRFMLIEGDGILDMPYSALNSECARFAGALFDLRYVHLLCWLPDLTVGPAADEFSPTPFGFAGGGVGCLMPMKEIKDRPPHYDFGGLPDLEASPMSERASTKGRETIAPPFGDQRFDSFDQWVAYAPSWLTCHIDYNNTEHGETKGWRGNHFTALCFDSLGRRCRIGADMLRARDENAFPVWWIWPDQIAEMVSRAAKAEGLTNLADATPTNPLSEGRERS